MRYLLLVAALALPLSAQYGAFTVIDTCSGQSSFMGSNVIIEESSGFCSAPIASGTISGTTLTVNLQTGYSADGMNSSTPDSIFFKGSNVMCLNAATAGIAISGATTTQVTASLPPALMCPSSATLTTGSVSGAYFQTSTSNIRWELKVVTKSPTLGWAAPTISVLTTASGRNSVGIGLTCSIGNPAGYTDGSVYYLAFLAQTGSSSCGTANGPDKGVQYSLFVCNLTSSGSFAPANFNASYCSLVENYTAGPPTGGMLDPHIHKLPSGAVDVYVSERDNSTVYYAVNHPPSLPVTSYNVWSVDDFPVTWSSPPTVGTGTFYVFDDPTWHSDARGSGGCEQYYKLTGFADLPNGNLRAFFQSNDIKTGSPGTNPYSALSPTTFSACDRLGAGTYADAFDFSGIFYSDLTAGTYLTGVALGANYTQLYPPANAQCVDPNGNIACYGEFPWALKDQAKLYFTGSLFTDDAVIDACAGPPAIGCQPNFDNEQLAATLTTDYTQPSTLPMTIVANRQWTNYNVLGTAACGLLLSLLNTPSNCGVLATPTPYFGGCSHLDVDEATSTVTCGNFANYLDPRGKKSAKTLVISLADSPFFAPMQVMGGVNSVSGGVNFGAGASFLIQ